MKVAEEFIRALYSIRDAIKGNNGESGRGDEKSLGYFELTDRPIGVIETDQLGIIGTYNEEALIKIDEDFIQELKVLKENNPAYVFIYDKDVSNTINFIKINSSGNAEIANGTRSCFELAPNRFVIQ